MTPNGAFAVGFILVALGVSAPGPRGAAVLVLVGLAFALVEVRGATMVALRRAALVVVPLAAFMAVVWVGIVGRSPSQIAADPVGTRSPALPHLAPITARPLF